jgi:hypothetical protein
MRRRIIWLCLLLVGILVLLGVKSWLIEPPAVRTQNAPGMFDAGRAKARLAYVLGDQRPHPVDSAANDAVRGRLVTLIQQMGLKPIVRDQVTCNDDRKARIVACTRVRNVIAVIGPPNGKALLLSAHYDSVPVGPGAGDDGAGVATLLEVGSILKERQLKRPVVLLFNEGEEVGLVGARAFLDDPMSRNVDSLLNFDARGVTGPVMMFETSEPNGAAISAFASSVRRPFASSLSTDMARLIPNDTDVTTYKERGWLTLNFAMVGNETRYHSPGDDVAALDPRTLQHMGDQALAAATQLSAGVPKAPGNRIFVDILGRAFVQLPVAVGGVLLVGLIILFAAIAWKRRVTLLEPSVAMAALVFASAVTWLALMLMGDLRAGTYWRANPEITFTAIYATALLAVVTVLRNFGGELSTERLRIGFWLLFLILGGLAALIAPGAIIYFLAPPIVVALGIVAGRWYRPAERIGGLLALVLLFVSWGELLATLEELFSPGPLWSVTPLASLMIIAVLIEAQGLIRSMPARTVEAIAGVLALIGWTAAAAAPAYSPNREERFTIEHVTTSPGHSAWSILNDGAALPPAYSRLGRWSRGKLPFSDRERWIAAAPPVPQMAAPALVPVEIVPNGDERQIRARLKANGAERIQIFAPENSRIRSAGATGSVRPMASAEGGKFVITCTGRSCDGMEFSIDQTSGKMIDFTLVGARDGLPPAATPLIAARPADARPQYTPDQTVAVAHVTL